MRFKYLVLFTLAFLSKISNAQENSTSKSLDKLIEETVNEYQLPSLSLVVCKGNNLVYSKAYGEKKKGLGDSVTLHSKYFWASVSKTFTASAIMKLNEEGMLRLDDKVVKYYPEFHKLFRVKKFSPDSITIRHLLTHTAGLPKFSRTWLLTDKNSSLDMEASLKTGKKIPLSIAPGTKYIYSNIGMNVLGIVIERVSGMSYAQYINEHIFKPLELRESTFLEANNLADTSLATLHVWSKKKKDFVPQTEPVYTNGSSSAGGLKMSPNDMSKVLMEYLKIYKGQKGIIKESSLETMWSRYKQFQALGWDCDETGEFWGLGPYVAKGGNLEWMSNSYIIVFPKKQVAVAICVNSTSTGFDGQKGFAAQIIKEAIKL